MDIHSLLDGGMTDAALFGLNLTPTQEEIDVAKTEAALFSKAAEALVDKVGLLPRLHIYQQPIYGPLVRMLSLAGWTVGGSGYFSVAFYKGGLAIKLSLRGQADAALDYLKWVMEQDSLAGLPTVYALSESEFTSMALMERYECARPLLNRKSGHYDLELDIEYAEIEDVLENGKEDSLGHATTETAWAIREAFDGKGWFDMHHGNVMVDRDGNLVITDPIGRSRERTSSYGGYSYQYYSNDNYSQAA